GRSRSDPLACLATGAGPGAHPLPLQRRRTAITQRQKGVTFHAIVRRAGGSRCGAGKPRELAANASRGLTTNPLGAAEKPARDAQIYRRSAANKTCRHSRGTFRREV